MQIEFIDISTFRGISSEAEHYYAKISTGDFYAEELIFDYGWSLDACARIGGKDLRFYPTAEQARQIAEKDHKFDLRNLSEEDRAKRIQWDIDDLTENGTIRFPSVTEILRQARKEHPEAVLYACFCGSHKEFLRLCCFKDNRVNPEIKSLLLPEKTK